MPNKNESELVMSESIELGNVEIANNQLVRDPGEYWVKIDGSWIKRDSKDGIAWPLVGISNIRKKGVFVQLDVRDCMSVQRKVPVQRQNTPTTRKLMQIISGKELSNIMLWIACVAMVAVVFILAYDPQILISPVNWTIVAAAPIVLCFVKILKPQPEQGPFDLALLNHEKLTKPRKDGLLTVSKRIKTNRSRADASGELVWTNRKSVILENN